MLSNAPVDALASITTAAWVVTVSALAALAARGGGACMPMARKLRGREQGGEKGRREAEGEGLAGKGGRFNQSRPLFKHSTCGQQ